MAPTTSWIRVRVLAAGATLLVGLTGVVRPSNAQTRTDSKTYADLAPGNRVELINPSTGASRVIYESRRWSTHGLSVSPAGRLVGILEVEEGQLEGSRYRVPPRSELLVLDTTGAINARVAADVQRYVWCGDTCIAYIVGDYTESGIGFVPHGAFIRDLTTGQVTPIPELAGPVGVTWAAFDSSLYFKVAGLAQGPVIYRYHVSTRTLSPTRFLDHNFSLSGGHYLHFPDEGDPTLRLYDSRTNQELPLRDIGRIGTPVRWLASGPDHLLLLKAPTVPDTAGIQPGRMSMVRQRPFDESDYVVYDVAARKVVRSLHGRIPRWSAPDDIVPFLTGGRINAITRP